MELDASNLEDWINQTTNSEYITLSPEAVLFLNIVWGVSVYYTSIMILIGCICCPLSFMVFSRQSYNSTSTSIYLRFLSVMDLGAILSGFPRFLVEQAWGVDIKGDNISCKVYLFFQTLFLYTSNWTLVVITLDRMLSVLWPHRVRFWCSKSAAKTRLVVVGFVNCLFCFVVCGLLCGTIEFTSPVTNTTVIHCGLVYQREKLLDIIPNIASVYLSFLPSFIVIICNVIIVCGIIKSRNRVQRPNNSVSTREFFNFFKDCKCPAVSNRNSNLCQRSANDLKKTSKSCDTTGCSTQSMNVHSSFSTASNEFVAEIISEASYATGVSSETDQNKATGTQSSVGSRREMSVTRTLLVISTTFVICTFPNTAYGQTLYYQAKGPISPVQQAIVDLLDILLFTNNSLNFFLYCMTGSRFRKEVKHVLKNIFSFCSLCGVK